VRDKKFPMYYIKTPLQSSQQQHCEFIQDDVVGVVSLLKKTRSHLYTTKATENLHLNYPVLH